MIFMGSTGRVGSLNRSAGVADPLIRSAGVADPVNGRADPVQDGERERGRSDESKSDNWRTPEVDSITPI